MTEEDGPLDLSNIKLVDDGKEIDGPKIKIKTMLIVPALLDNVRRERIPPDNDLGYIVDIKVIVKDTNIMKAILDNEHNGDTLVVKFIKEK